MYAMQRNWCLNVIRQLGMKTVQVASEDAHSNKDSPECSGIPQLCHDGEALITREEEE